MKFWRGERERKSAVRVFLFFYEAEQKLVWSRHPLAHFTRKVEFPFLMRLHIGVTEMIDTPIMLATGRT